MNEFIEFKAVVIGKKELGQVLVVDEAKENKETWYKCRPLEFRSVDEWLPETMLERVEEKQKK